jgi:hypothetical protein
MQPNTGVIPVARPTRRLPRWIKRAAFESGLIVFSLLLAFVINEWREHRSEREDLRQARALVVEELRHNLATIESPEILAHHAALLAKYRTLAEAENPAGEPLFESGVHVAPLRDAAWRSLEARPIIADVPYDQLVVLADLYQEQQRLEAMHWAMIPQLIAVPAESAGVDAARTRKRTLVLYLADVVSAERRLLQRYREALEILAEKT